MSKKNETAAAAESAKTRGQFITFTTDDAECVLGNVTTMKGGVKS